MNKTSKAWLVGILCVLLSYGCATIVKGSTQKVSFQSDPQGVVVDVDGKVLGKTPFAITIDKKDGQTLTFSKEGYKDRRMQLTTITDVWFFGNILFGLAGFLSSTTDAATGAIYEYSPGQYFVTLEPDNGTMVSQEAAERAKIRDFVIKSHTNIIKELSQGGGETVNTLLELLLITEEERQKVIGQLKTLAEIYQDAPSYAERVLDLYSGQPKK